MTQIAKSRLPKIKTVDIYITSIGLVGIFLCLWGISSNPALTASNVAILALLMVLAATVQVTATLITTKNGPAISVATAISLAAIPVVGAGGALLVTAVAEISLWLIAIRSSRPPWKQAFRQLSFNIGMNTSAVGVGSIIYFNLISATISWPVLLQQTVVWLTTAVAVDQINFWLFAVVLRLEHGISPVDVFKDNRWAMPLNVFVSGVGGGLLALALIEFGWLGAAVFFIPIAASAYSFQHTAREQAAQNQRLEELVELRTAALEKANDELAALGKEKDAFLAVLTHDMRTPLTSIKGFTSLLLGKELYSSDNKLPPDKIKGALQSILRSQDNLLEIVNNILDLERLSESGSMLLEKSTTDLAVDVVGVCELLTSQADSKNITLQFNPVPDYDLTVIVDVSKINRVITNLVSNAIKYTPNNGTVTVETFQQDRYAVVSVSDTGYGIPADELPFIFDRYSRVKKHKTLAVGTGLGLAIVKMMVEAHDGIIEVESIEDKGSTFTIKLPIQ